MMRILQRMLPLVLLLLAACGGKEPVGGVPPSLPVSGGTATAEIAPTRSPARATAGAVPQPAATADARPTPTPWYPILRYVAPSTLPYDPNETIRILPVYACPRQSCQWLGDLPSGLQVSVTALSEDGLDCFVSGKVVQGWEVEGWVSCSRLAAEKPVDGP